MLSLIILSTLSMLIFYTLFYTYMKVALKKNYVDTPKNISVHDNVVPTGSGIVIVICLTLYYFTLKSNFFIESGLLNYPNRDYLLIFSILILGFINFYDDIKEVHPIYRLTAHFFLVMLSLPLFSFLGFEYYNYIPQKILIIFIVFLWVYLINIYNFIDGSNGYLTINAISSFIIFFLNYYEKGLFNFNLYISFFMILILLVYFLFNFPKAKLFMGDSGSIIIGYLIGYLFFVTLLDGYVAIAFAMICYPVMDVSFSILRKVINGHYPWERLFDYFFLRALKGKNYNHKKIFLISLLYNLINLLIIFAIIKFQYNILILATIFCSSLKLILFNSFSKIRP